MTGIWKFVSKWWLFCQCDFKSIFRLEYFSNVLIQLSNSTVVKCKKDPRFVDNMMKNMPLWLLEEGLQWCKSSKSALKCILRGVSINNFHFLNFVLQSNYRNSPASMVSISVVPSLVRFINHTKYGHSLI